MKLSITASFKSKAPKAKKKVEEAIRLGLRDTIVAVHGDAVRGSPWKTGHNRRSIASEVSGMGTVQQGGDAKLAKVVDDSKLEAACYSTSGYGGYLEVGTVKMPARPYFKPALDRHSPNLPKAIRGHL